MLCAHSFHACRPPPSTGSIRRPALHHWLAVQMPRLALAGLSQLVESICWFTFPARKHPRVLQGSPALVVSGAMRPARAPRQ